MLGMSIQIKDLVFSPYSESSTKIGIKMVKTNSIWNQHLEALAISKIHSNMLNIHIRILLHFQNNSWDSMHVLVL